MIRRVISLIAMFVLLIIGLPMAATQAVADDGEYYDGPIDTLDYDSEDLCLVSPEQVVEIEHDGYNLRERRWKKEIPTVAEISHKEYRFYRDIPAVDAVEKTLYTFYRDVPAVEDTFSSWYRWKQIVPGKDGIEECKWQKKIPGQKEVKEYRWEAVFKKGKELKGVEVSSSRVCSKGNSGTWYLMPENVQPERFDGIAPTGNVNLSVYCNSYKNGLKGSDSVAYRYGETYTVYYPGPTASDWTESGSTPAAPSGSSWGARKERVKTPATDDTWDYQWATSDPGEGWTKVDGECRWKEEPVDESVEWFPSEDGWTQEIKTDPWIKVAEESKSNEDGVPGYREFKTLDGTTLVETEAAEFEESSFDGWTVLNTRNEIVSGPVDGYREFLAAEGKASQKIEDAVWMTDDSVKGWTVLDTKKVVTQDAVDAFWVYYLAGGEPTLTLGDENWTAEEPDRAEGWLFIDERDRWVAESWYEEVIVDEVWEPCETDTPDKPKTIEKLPHTGPNDASGILIGISAALILVGSAVLWLRSRKK